MFENILLIIITFSGGITVGTAIASFITLLDIVPRLSQITNSFNLIVFYERILVSSAVMTTLLHFLGVEMAVGKLILIPIGLFIGAFIGLLAAALAEVLNVIPVLERNLNLGTLIYIPLLGLSLGKVVGSLINWLVITNID